MLKKIILIILIVMPSALFGSYMWEGSASYEKNGIILKIKYSYSDGLTPEGVIVYKFINFDLRRKNQNIQVQDVKIKYTKTIHNFNQINVSEGESFFLFTLIPRQGLVPVSFELNYKTLDSRGHKKSYSTELIIYTEGGLKQWVGKLLVSEKNSEDINKRTPTIFKGKISTDIYHLLLTYTVAPEIPGNVYKKNDILSINVITDKGYFIGPDSYIKFKKKKNSIVNIPSIYPGMNYSVYSRTIKLSVKKNDFNSPLEVYLEFVDSDLNVLKTKKLKFKLRLKDKKTGNNGNIIIKQLKR